MTKEVDGALEELSAEAWERLCDGCALCCLVKLEDEETGEIEATILACRFLDLQTFRCACYEERSRRRADCLVLTPELVRASGALPPTCAYRRRARGLPLPAWHPLVSGDPATVRRAFGALRRRFVPEDLVGEDELEDFVIELPDET